ncbi:hypothetical protein UlMin_013149 [Ulmus minor]
MEKVKLNSWVRGKCIGKGSFGSVNLAVDESDSRVFAVKSVDAAGCVPSQLEALENEIRILRSINSPYVVEYLGDDVSYEGTSSFRNLHLEYMPSGTAADVAARRFGSGVDETTVRSITWGIVSALRYVHSLGIVHCDVKGKNVLVGPNFIQSKLADFGSAIEVSKNKNGAPIQPRGSPLWMAPEVVRRESQGPESDVWSLGCTVVELVTGKPAWEDRGGVTLSRICFSDELPEIPQELSDTGRDFLDKCLRRDPSKRWSCDQLLEHPYLASVAPDSVSLNSSPRCVLDWFNSELDESHDETYNYDNWTPLHVSAKGRIGKLATKGGANWESDGWTMVRVSTSYNEETGGANCYGGGGGRVKLEYSDLLRTEQETAGTSSEYSDERRTKLEYRKSCGSCVLLECGCCNYCEVGCEAGSSCRYGVGIEDLTVYRIRIISFYNLYSRIFFSYYSTMFNNKFNLFISYILLFFLHLRCACHHNLNKNNFRNIQLRLLKIKIRKFGY